MKASDSPRRASRRSGSIVEKLKKSGGVQSKLFRIQLGEVCRPVMHYKLKEA
jgi:hypothetical protein